MIDLLKLSEQINNVYSYLNRDNVEMNDEMQQVRNILKQALSSQWVKCDEGFPDIIGNYLVYSNEEHSKVIGWAFFNSDKKWCEGNRFYHDVTHWCNLPQPPEEE